MNSTIYNTYSSNKLSSSLFPFIVILLGIALIIFIIVIKVFRTQYIKKTIFDLSENAIELTQYDFLKIRNASNGGRGEKHISNRYDFTGVYILYNQTKNMYYVGQGKSVFQRINSHFTGHGNGDVYADY